MLNDGVLAGLGFDPAIIAKVGELDMNWRKEFLSKLFGPTREFQERQTCRDAGARILKDVKALIPSLPEWIQQTVTDDREEFRQKMIRPNMNASDYKAAISWIEGRKDSWQLMLQEGPITPAQMIQKLGSREAYEKILEAEASGYVTTVTPSGAVVSTPPSGVAFQEAGFNLPMMLVVGGVLAWLLLGRK
jgi:hypothetical protein